MQPLRVLPSLMLCWISGLLHGVVLADDRLPMWVVVPSSIVVGGFFFAACAALPRKLN